MLCQCHRVWTIYPRHRQVIFRPVPTPLVRRLDTRLGNEVRGLERRRIGIFSRTRNERSPQHQGVCMNAFRIVISRLVQPSSFRRKRTKEVQSPESDRRGCARQATGPWAQMPLGYRARLFRHKLDPGFRRDDTLFAQLASWSHVGMTKTFVCLHCPQHRGGIVLPR